MTLASVKAGRQATPEAVLLYGISGLGKTTWGGGAPSPIFIDTERGSSHLDVPRFPTPETWLDVLDAVRTLETGEHAYQTLVIDTLDHMEPLLWAYICARDGEKSVEAYGYGKGYNAALDEWRVLLAALERLQAKRGMHVVFLAHHQIRTFKNPEGEDYDRYQLKLNEKAAGLIKEWCTIVLFGIHETLANEDTRTKRVRGISTGARLAFTAQTAAYDAKNRHQLPEAMPLNAEEFWAAIAAYYEQRAGQDPSKLTEEIKTKAAQVGGEVAAKALDALGRAKGNAEKLAQLNDWLNAKLMAKGDK